MKSGDSQQATNPAPEQVIRRIAEVAHAVGWQAGVGAMETAGTIVSILAANPQHIDRFMAEGFEIFVDGTVCLDVVNGCLTYFAKSGELLSPGELHRRRGGAVQ